jgi:hypothetical protein
MRVGEVIGDEREVQGLPHAIRITKFRWVHVFTIYLLQARRIHPVCQFECCVGGTLLRMSCWLLVRLVSQKVSTQTE